MRFTNCAAACATDLQRDRPKKDRLKTIAKICLILMGSYLQYSEAVYPPNFEGVLPFYPALMGPYLLILRGGYFLSLMNGITCYHMGVLPSYAIGAYPLILVTDLLTLRGLTSLTRGGLTSLACSA